MTWTDEEHEMAKRLDYVLGESRNIYAAARLVLADRAALVERAELAERDRGRAADKMARERDVMRAERDAARAEVERLKAEVADIAEKLRVAVGWREVASYRGGTIEQALAEVERLKARATPPADLDGWIDVYIRASCAAVEPTGGAEAGIAAVLAARDAWWEKRLMRSDALDAFDHAVEQWKRGGLDQTCGDLTNGMRAAIAAVRASAAPAPAQPGTTNAAGGDVKTEMGRHAPAPPPPLPEVPEWLVEMAAPGAEPEASKSTLVHVARHLIALDAALRARGGL